MMFKKNATGDFSRDIQETLRVYSDCTRLYSVSAKKQDDSFVYIFDGAARKIFLHHTNDRISFDSKSQIVLQEYVSDARQIHAKGTLQNLCLPFFMAKRNITDVFEGL